MYKDPWFSFGKYFLMGMDFDFLMLDVCTISFVIQVSRFNVGMDVKLLMGILVAYILDSLLIMLRGYLGRRNLSKQTMIDEQFLI